LFIVGCEQTIQSEEIHQTYSREYAIQTIGLAGKFKPQQYDSN